VATKLFVGNLPFQATTADLEELFSQVGTVASVNLITDKFSGQSRGFGFVEMTDAQEAQQAITRFHGSELQGRALTVNEAKPREERPGGGICVNLTTRANLSIPTLRVIPTSS
jgi:cold-inducible RNA-binding protein